MTETRQLRALIDKLNRLTRWYPQWNGAPLGWVKATDLNEVTADLSALLSEPQAAQGVDWKLKYDELRDWAEANGWLDKALRQLAAPPVLPAPPEDDKP